LDGLRVRERRKEEEEDEYEEQPSGILRNWHCELHLIQMGWWLLCFLYRIQRNRACLMLCFFCCIYILELEETEQIGIDLLLPLSLSGIFMDTNNNHNMDSAPAKKQQSVVINNCNFNSRIIIATPHGMERRRERLRERECERVIL
jgi:hypothetical protein